MLYEEIDKETLFFIKDISCTKPSKWRSKKVSNFYFEAMAFTGCILAAFAAGKTPDKTPTINEIIIPR